MNTIYGGGGVEVRPTRKGYMSSSDTGSEGMRPAARRSSALPASTFYGSHPGKSPPYPNGSGGCQPDPPAPDDNLDADGKRLDYAALSRGW